MHKALEQLPRLDSEILTLRADSGLTYEEIATILGISRGNVKIRVHRTRVKLRQILAREEKGHE